MGQPSTMRRANERTAAKEPSKDEWIPRPTARPFVKWVGGKRALIAERRNRAPQRSAKYWEPFVGGGAVFFSRRTDQAAVLADVNPELTNAYLVVKHFPEDLIDELEAHARHHHEDEQYYYRVRRMSHLASPISAAARFIYLNKTCYNGLYRVNRRGQFNVAKGSYANPAICDQDGIRAASASLQNAEILHQDFGRAAPHNDDFVYCDPPHDRTYAGYTTKRFDADQQRRLRDVCVQWHQEGALVMISNSDTDLIRSLYADPPFQIESVSAPRYISASGKGRGRVTELIITTYPTEEQREETTP